MRLSKLLDVLNGLAPESLAEPWDKVGLQLGDPAWTVRSALLCIDLTEAVLEEAIASRVNLLVAYHPPIFSPLAALTVHDPKQRIILQAARKKIAIYSPHTALDAAPGGVNDWLCDGIGKGRVRAIKEADGAGATSYKVVTFVPHDWADAVRAAMADAGAGRIGHYTQCSFGSDGQGTFLGDDTTSPAVGRRGRLESVNELRLEMLCHHNQLREVVAALKTAHPYEEVAYDVYPLHPPPEPSVSNSAAPTGQGRVIDLDRPVTPATLVQRLKKHLGVRHLHAGVPQGKRSIARVGLCAGAGGSLLPEGRGRRRLSHRRDAAPRRPRRRPARRLRPARGTHPNRTPLPQGVPAAPRAPHRPIRPVVDQQEGCPPRPHRLTLAPRLAPARLN